VRTLALNLFLAVTWVALTGEYTPSNLAAGFVLGYLLLLLFRDTLLPEAGYFGKVWQTLYFTAFFLWELVLANLRVAWEILTPGNKMRPGIVAIPLDVQSNLGITILANLITLTPGTLSLDVSDDRRTLYVHGMYVDDPDAFRQRIKEGFEKRVRELLR
jgi:multicomponent Na+:H+ antiporter subunit E